MSNNPIDGFNIGDCVIIMKAAASTPEYDHFVGKAGDLQRCDPDDQDRPFLVKVKDNSGQRQMIWVNSVKKVEDFNFITELEDFKQRVVDQSYRIARINDFDDEIVHDLLASLGVNDLAPRKKRLTATLTFDNQEVIDEVQDIIVGDDADRAERALAVYLQHHAHEYFRVLYGNVSNVKIEEVATQTAARRPRRRRTQSRPAPD